uniref:Serpentine receptor class gamma n=1 Tax=Globodera rostochiensis TaxID=31243 RepID=A0A914HR12_GLORO
MSFVDWSNSVQIPITCLTICITIPSTALYIAEIVTILRHKKFHNNSFFALFVMRVIPDLLYVLNSFYGQRLPSIIGAVLYSIYSKFPNLMLAIPIFFNGYTYQANNLVTAFILLNRLTAIIMPLKHEKLWQTFLPLVTIFVYCVPVFSYWPMLKMNAILVLNYPNSTTDHSFFIYEAGDAPYCSYMSFINADFSVIFMTLCVLLNIGTFVAYKQSLKRIATNGSNDDLIERKLLIYAVTTFLGHMFVACLYLMPLIPNFVDRKTKAMLFYIYYPLIMDTGTVVLSSWFLLWASSTLRQQLIKDFSIIRKTNIQNNRLVAMEGPRNNNHRPVGGSVGHLQTRFSSSVQQLPTIS